MHNLLMAFFAVIASMFSCSNTPKSQSKVIRYEYSHNGTVAQPISLFKVEKIDNDSCLVTFYNHDKEATYDEDGNYILDKSMQSIELLDSISTIVNEHKMKKYKKEYKPFLDVLDGDSWYLEIKFDDESHSTSHGYCAGPKDDGITIITRMLRERIKGL